MNKQSRILCLDCFYLIVAVVRKEREGRGVNRDGGRRRGRRGGGKRREKERDTEREKEREKEKG